MFFLDGALSSLILEPCRVQGLCLPAWPSLPKIPLLRLLVQIVLNLRAQCSLALSFPGFEIRDWDSEVLMTSHDIPKPYGRNEHLKTQSPKPQRAPGQIPGGTSLENSLC